MKIGYGINDIRYELKRASTGNNNVTKTTQTAAVPKGVTFDLNDNETIPAETKKQNKDEHSETTKTLGIRSRRPSMTKKRKAEFEVINIEDNVEPPPKKQKMADSELKNTVLEL